jgi:hypothetical protein
MFLGSVRLFLESNFLCLYMYMPDGIFTNRVHYHSTTTSVAVVAWFHPPLPEVDRQHLIPWPS